ncbi:MAG: hypothetical protein GXP27_18275 [Planctomycetes bacterium]|nr:hypothetical protein [Planctomycetota bacterium]
MKYSDLIVFIPSYSVEDLPVGMPDLQAASLLNAFAVAWHPVLLAGAEVLPRWHRADEPPEVPDRSLIFVTEACGKRLPKGWIDQVRDRGCVVLEELVDRDVMLREALKPLEESGPLPKIDPELVADFFALGTCYLLMELLTRHMHYYNDLDEVYLRREGLSAAESALANDSATAREHLRNCFESLTEGRERFYPIESFLIDLCVLDEKTPPEMIPRPPSGAAPINLIVAARDLERWHASSPDRTEALGEAWETETVDFAGGTWRDVTPTLVPLDSLLWQFHRGLDVFRRLFGRRPGIWAQGSFGLTSSLPQILKRFGFDGVLHVLFGEGTYPESDYGAIRWQGCDGTVIDAISRAPLPADKASSYLDLAVRLAESMEHDQTAAMAALVRRADSEAPWLDDLRRMQRYSPCVGRFVTLAEYLREVESSSQLSVFDSAEYLSPTLEQTGLESQPNPISRHADHFLRWQRFRTLAWYRALAQALKAEPIDLSALEEGPARIDAAYAEATADAGDRADRWLAEAADESARALRDVILQGTPRQPGYLVINPLSFPRKVVVEVSADEPAPRPTGPVLGVQTLGDRHAVLVTVPGCGFAWFPKGAPDQPAVDEAASVPLAEDNCLRNEFFEAYVNEETGGLLRLNTYRRDTNRLSQQLAFRFPWARPVARTEDGIVNKSYYSQMRCRSLQVTSSGPHLGEIVATGEIIDQQSKAVLAEFRQAFRVWRHRPVLELEIELNPHQLPQAAPWASYYASRFAWNDATASLTRSILETAQTARGERIETPGYLEIASEQQRTTLLFGGLPFHRKTGPRMLDTLLITAGETRRRFRLWIAIDQDYPLQAAWDVTTPLQAIPTDCGPPRPGQTGWLFHVDAKNVQILGLSELLPEPADEQSEEKAAVSALDPPAGDLPQDPWDEWHDQVEAWDDLTQEGAEWRDEPIETSGATDANVPHQTATFSSASSSQRSAARRGFTVRLIETEGRGRAVRLRCFRTPASARQRDFEGRTLRPVSVQGDAVLLDLGPYEIAEVELFFN